MLFYVLGFAKLRLDKVITSHASLIFLYGPLLLAAIWFSSDFLHAILNRMAWSFRLGMRCCPGCQLIPLLLVPSPAEGHEMP